MGIGKNLGFQLGLKVSSARARHEAEQAILQHSLKGTGELRQGHDSRGGYRYVILSCGGGVEQAQEFKFFFRGQERSFE